MNKRDSSISSQQLRELIIGPELTSEGEEVDVHYFYYLIKFFKYKK